MICVRPKCIACVKPVTPLFVPSDRRRLSPVTLLRFAALCVTEKSTVVADDRVLPKNEFLLQFNSFVIIISSKIPSYFVPRTL